MPARSIRIRLTAAYASILALTFAIAGIGVWMAVRHSIDEAADTELRSRLQSMRGYVERQMNAGGYRHLARELDEDVGAIAGGLYIRFADSHGKWLYRSPAAVRWQLALPDGKTLPQEGAATTFDGGGEEFRLLSAPLSAGTLQLGLSLREFDEMLRGFATYISMASPLLLVLASVGGYWLSGRALRPVDQIAAAASRISAANLRERLPSRGNGDELDRLSSTLNGMLARLDQAFTRITQFTADASHELRTPIAIMRTAAELAGSRPRGVEEQDKAWSVITTQIERTSQLIADLLVLARADSGVTGLIFERIDLAPFITEVCEEMTPVSKAAGLDLRLSVSHPCQVPGDREALRRVLLILLDNAIKFTPPGGVVTVSLQRQESESPMVAIEVADSGIGISVEDLQFIFDRFYRAAKDRSRKTGGAGLGLSIAQWIVASHDGEIHVRSESGTGSTFVVCLPLARI